jgi:signal transduction histidine kinase
MNHLTEHIHHLTHFDGLLHWCIWLALVGFPIVMGWMTLRLLLPLHQLARQAERIAAGESVTFDAPLHGIREVQMLRRSLQTMVAQLAAAQERELMYRSALTQSQETERRHIAREIHDDTIQSLIVVAHSIERAAQAASAATRQHLDAARQQIITTIENLRQMIAHLRPTVLDELGLVAAIETLCEQHPRLHFCVKGQAYSLSHSQELALFRAAQEAIHNAEQHAQPTRIEAVLHYEPSGVSLCVSDNGCGFALPCHLRDFAAQGHYGLIGLRERIEHLGGAFDLESAPAQGTRLTVRLPTAQPHPLLQPV